MINVQSGELFSVDFKATPATGYQWTLTAVPAGIELLENSFAADQSVGGPAPVPPTGIQRFHFLAAQAGRVELVFELKRAWENEPLQQRIEVVQIAP